MEQLELRMTTDLETALPAEIVFNFDELEKALAARVEHYNHLVVTEDAIQEAKADRANLRKLREALEDSRKDTKKKWNLPLATYEERMKKLVARIDAPIASIDGQVKAFEEREREAKREEIRAVYDEQVPEDFREIIPFERILNPRWLNKTTTMKSITEEIVTLVKRTNVDMVLMDGLDPAYLGAVRSKYIETLDINVALMERDKLMAAETAFRQREAQRAAFQAQAETKPPVAAQEPVREPAPPVPQPRADEKRWVLKLEFPAITRGQADALKKFLQANNIEFINITNN